MSYRRSVGANRFDCLDTDEEYTVFTSTVNISRKAEKKLKEIENLESRPICELNTEELAKLSRKQEWMNILYPKQRQSTYIPTKREAKKLIEKCKKLERKRIETERKRMETERKAEEEKRRLFEAEEKRRKEEEEKMAKIVEEERKKHIEQRERMRKLEQELRNKVAHQNKKVQLETEYVNMLACCNGNNDKTFRKMSLKYHPDRNKSEPELATQNQSYLLDLKEKYDV